MRVTQQMLDRSLLQAINQRMVRLRDSNRQLSSGDRVGTVSDDPTASAQILRARRTEEQIATYLQNVDSVDAVLSTATSSLQTASETMSRVRQLATQAATGTYTDADRKNMASEVDESIESLVSLANSRLNGQYIFAGARGETRPFEVTRDTQGQIQDVRYCGAGTSTEATVGPDRTAEMNMVGRDVFQRRGDTFGTLVQLREAVKAGDQEEIENLLGETKRQEKGIRESLGIAGARQSQLGMLRSSLERFSSTNGEILSELSDADMAEVTIDYQRNMTSLQWALKVSAQASRPSLVDYL